MIRELNNTSNPKFVALVFVAFALIVPSIAQGQNDSAHEATLEALDDIARNPDRYHTDTGEYGGFVYRENGRYHVSRIESSQGGTLDLNPLRRRLLTTAGRRADDFEIVTTFHTHPLNEGQYTRDNEGFTSDVDRMTGSSWGIDVYVRQPNGQTYRYDHDTRTEEQVEDGVSFAAGTPSTGGGCGDGGCSVSGGVGMQSSSTGDPHIRTCDGMVLGFQAAGEFIAYKSTDESFEVQVRQQAVHNVQASKNMAVAARMYGHRIGVYALPSGSRIMYDGLELQDADLPLSIDGRGEVRREGSQVTLEWQDGSVVESYSGHELLDLHIALSPAHRGRTSGLYGTCDGSVDNELTTRDGEVLTPDLDDEEEFVHNVYGLFGNSWRIDQAESLFDYTEGRTTVDHQFPDYPQSYVSLADLDEATREEATASCIRQGVVVEPFLSDCVLDIGLTGEHHFAQSGARAASFEGYVTRSAVIDSDDMVIVETFDGVAGDVHFFQIKDVTQSLNLSTYELRSPSGKRLFGNCVWRCNQPGAVTFPETGKYTARIRTSRGERGQFTSVRHKVPPPHVASLTLPARVGPNIPVLGMGIIEIAGSVDQYLIDGTASESLSIELTHRDGKLYFGRWIFTSPSGEVLLDTIFPSSGSPPIEFDLEESGIYRLTITGGDSWPSEDDYGRGRYQLTVLTN